jgi:predicted nuclease of restriction endonuclease-like (RecB) superfamily
MTQSLLAEDYPAFLKELKQSIRDAQLRASVAVNSELVLLYWRIGRDILFRQERERWGTKVIDRLSGDLKKSFPEMKGFSPRNLKYMRAFAEAWPEEAFVQEALAQITWYHNVTLIEKVAGAEERTWYAKATIRHGWSRSLLVHQIETGCISALVKPSPTLTKPCHGRNLTSRSRSPKILMLLTFSCSGKTFTSGNWTRTPGTSAALSAGVGYRICVRRKSISS